MLTVVRRCIITGNEKGCLLYTSGNVILSFVDHFPKDLELYRILTTRLSEVAEAQDVYKRQGGNNAVKISILREVVNKGQNHVAEVQQPITFA